MPKDPLRPARVLVIGAGMGGLSAALALAARGCDVAVLEAQAHAGGKLHPLAIGGRSLDTGPTVFTLLPVFESIFAEAGLDLHDYIRLTPLSVLARHFWPDGSRLDLFADPARNVAAIGDFAGAAAARGYRDFQAQAAAIHAALDAPFLRAARPGMLDLARSVRPGALWAMQPFATLWQALGRFFADPRLRQLFGRYATYCGASPFEAPATLMLIAHVEQCGVWQIEGGMHRLAQAFLQALERLGGRFRADSPVKRILVGARGIEGVMLADGETLPADFILCNADRGALGGGMFGPAAQAAVVPLPARERTLSAVTMSLLGRAEGLELSHHNVLFGADYAREFECLGRLRRLPEDPTLYLCAQDRSGEGGAPPPAGAERLFALINAPPCGDDPALDVEEPDTCRALFHRTMMRHGLRLDPGNDLAIITGPRSFEQRYPGTGGALYGMAMHGAFAPFRRPGARTKLPGLFLAGGSVHPGAGLPMAALSGRLAAEALMEDLASTRRFHPAATPGGIATPSATTAPMG